MTCHQMPIAFPSINCGVILSQHSGILVSVDVVSKRESHISLHYKLFAGKHVADVVMTSEATSSTSKACILVELKEVSKDFGETIRSSTERKASVDNLIIALSAKDEDMAEGNEDAINNEEAIGNDDAVGGED
jgi:hypothetical protein